MAEADDKPPTVKAMEQADRFASLLEQPRATKTKAEMAKEAADTINVVTREITDMLRPFPQGVRQSILSQVVTDLAIPGPGPAHHGAWFAGATTNSLHEVQLVNPRPRAVDSFDALSDDATNLSQAREAELLERVNSLMNSGERMMSSLQTFLDRMNRPLVDDLDDELLSSTTAGLAPLITTDKKKPSVPREEGSDDSDLG